MVTVVGARPQFIKAAAVCRVIHGRDDIEQIIVHTGQHYDANMSDVFFSELSIPVPAYNLNIGSGTHGEQTGRMLIDLEAILLEVRPDIVLLYGDTNSTLAGALAAVKLHMPIAHVEAGLRSFNRIMPEETNRILTDHISNWLFCPTDRAVEQLKSEGITENVENVGDVMYDNHLHFLQLAEANSSILEDLKLIRGDSLVDYCLATVHRPENTNFPERLRGIFGALAELSLPVILPLHPRTKAFIDKEHIEIGANIERIDPIPYLDMCLLQKRARAILTDSGGIQKESFFCRVPCITLRDETEWVETVESGWNRIVGADRELIVSALEELQEGLPVHPHNVYGDGNAGERIVQNLLQVDARS